MATNAQRNRRHRRIRARVSGTNECPRVVVFRSNKSLFVQAIDDTMRKTLVGMRTKEDKTPKVAQSTVLAEEMAKGLNTLGIKRIVFDRGGYQYHGRVKAFAEALRAAGLQF